MLKGVKVWLSHYSGDRYQQQDRWRQSPGTDRQRFAAFQVEYFSYLHHMLSELKGSRTLRDVFFIDAERYGGNHWRGRLAQRWLLRYEHSGGDLHATWFDCCDIETLSLLRTAQAHGERALIIAFKQVAEVLRTKRQIRRAFLQMVGPGAFAALILMGMLAVVPLYTVPQLFSAFGDLPDIYLGPYSLALRRFSEHLLSYGVAIIGSFLFLIVLMRLSLPRLIGKIRNRLEAVQPWSSYRLYHGFRVFILLSLLLRVHPASQRLSVCLDSIETDNNAWLFWRLSITRQRLRDGSSSYAAFDQNFLRTKDAWYFSDIASAQGLEEGFAATASHLHEQLLAIFNRYSQILKWGLLIGSVGALVSLGLWHFVAINELRTGLLLFHSS